MAEHSVLFIIDCYNIKLLCKMVCSKSLGYIIFNKMSITFKKMKLKVSKFFFISFFVSLLVFGITNHEFPYKIENNMS